MPQSPELDAAIAEASAATRELGVQAITMGVPALMGLLAWMAARRNRQKLVALAAAAPSLTVVPDAEDAVLQDGGVLRSSEHPSFREHPDEPPA